MIMKQDDIPNEGVMMLALMAKSMEILSPFEDQMENDIETSHSLQDLDEEVILNRGDLCTLAVCFHFLAKYGGVSISRESDNE
tara:strand:+ start:580 stop:828 length:249 start_codon:yes stop_codon:yes gene_type:complete